MQYLLFEFQHLNGATWFTFSFLLMLAVFFRFTRFFSLRNWDVVLVFLLMPGLLAVVRSERGDLGRLAGADLLALNRLGYIWLFVVTGVLMARAAFDVLLVRRSRGEPNLNISGMVALGVMLLCFLMAEVVQKDPDPSTRAAIHAKGDAPAVVDKPARPGDEGAHPVTTVVGRPVFEFFRTIAGRIADPEALTPTAVEVGAARSFAIFSHLLTITALLLIGWQLFDGPATGVAMATLYLLAPTTAANVEKVDHLLPAMCLTWAVYCYRRPALAGMFFGLASWFVFPLFLAPLWIGYYWGRGAKWFIFAFASAAACVSLLVLLFAPSWTLGGLYNSAAAWLPLRLGGTDLAPGIWTQSTHAYRLPIFVSYLVFAVLAGFWPRKKNLAELLALSAVLVMGTQFWYDFRGGCYVNWYLPLLLLVIFRPNLAHLRPAEQTKTIRTVTT